jgi:hypothetical protein
MTWHDNNTVSPQDRQNLLEVGKNMATAYLSGSH